MFAEHVSRRPPEVSVVMAVYNGARQLSATLESVLSQRGCDIELIVIDDGSTDETARLLDEIARRDDRVRVLHQINAGLTRALIAGCAAAQAPLIARQDSGDLSLPGRLAAQAAALDADPSLAFVSCATEYAEPGGALLYRQAGSGRAKVPTDIVDLRERFGTIDGPSHHGSVMFRRDAYERAGGYRAQFYFGQDWDLWYRLARQGRFQMLPQALYRATLAPGDISARHKPQQEALARLSLESLRRHMAGRDDDDVLAKAAAIQPSRSAPASAAHEAAACYFLGECLRRNGNGPLAREYFRRALTQAPWHWKARIRLAQVTWRGAVR